MINENDLPKLINEGNVEEALKLAESELEKNPKNLTVLFFHAFISFVYYKDETEKTIKEFEILANSNNKFQGISLALLAILYSHTNEYEKCIKVASDNRCTPGDFTLDFNFSVAVAYYSYDLEKSLEYVNKCIEEESDNELDFYEFKEDVLTSLERFEEAEKLLETIYTKFGASMRYYFMQSKVLYYKYFINGERETLERALEELNRAEQYGDLNDFLVYHRIKILTYLNRVDEALELLESVKDKMDESELIVNKIILFDANELYDRILAIKEEAMKKDYSWSVYDALAKSLYSKRKTIDDFVNEQKLYIKCYEVTGHIRFIHSIFLDARRIHNYKLVLDFAEDYKKKNPEDTDINYYIYECKAKLNYSYDDLYKAITAPGVSSDCGLFYFLYQVSEYDQNPRYEDKLMRKLVKNNIQGADSFQRKTIGCYYLFGLHGLQINYSKARQLIEEAYNESKDEPCVISTMGLYYEVIGDYNKAFKLYEEAYNLRIQDSLATCNCSDAYYAHALLKGIGVSVNIPKAREVVLTTLEQFKELSNNTTIYLYTYFALNNDARFDLHKAKEMLLSTISIKRYDITRALMLKCVLKKLGEDTTEVESLIKKCLKYGTKTAKKFYKENKNKDIVYICYDAL